MFFYQTEPDRLGFSEGHGKGCVCSPRLREFQSQALQTDIFDPKQYYIFFCLQSLFTFQLLQGLGISRVATSMPFSESLPWVPVRCRVK